MDARHETLAQEMSNELIHYMNKYIQENLDDVILDEELCENMQKISELIYAKSGMQIDVEHIISKKNLLSIDTVFLPLVEEESLYPSQNKAADFTQFLDQIISIAENHINRENDEFYASLLNCLSRYTPQATI